MWKKWYKLQLVDKMVDKMAKNKEIGPLGIGLQTTGANSIA